MKAKELAAILMKNPNEEIFFDGLGFDIELRLIEMGSLKNPFCDTPEPVLVIELKHADAH